MKISNLNNCIFTFFFQLSFSQFFFFAIKLFTSVCFFSAKRRVNDDLRATVKVKLSVFIVELGFAF